MWVIGTNCTVSRANKLNYVRLEDRTHCGAHNAMRSQYVIIPTATGERH